MFVIAIASSRLSEVFQKPGDCTTGVKRRRQFDLSSWNLPKRSSLAEWVSEYKLDGRVEISIEPDSEIGDGMSSRVYCGYYNGETVALKQLKSYHPRLSSTLIESYEGLFNLSHENVGRILGLCVKAGQIVIELCEKSIGEFTMHSLADLLNHMGDELPT